MKKVGFLLLMGSSLVFGSDIDTCGVFTNVLQTRKMVPPSIIKMKSGDAYIYNSPSCTLDTGAVVQGVWAKKLFCKNGRAMAPIPPRWGKSLDEDKIFSGWEFYDSQASEDVGGGDSPTITNENENLTSNKYETIEQDYNHYSFTWSPSGNDIAIKKFNNILNNVTIENIENKDVKIGYFKAGSKAGSYDNTKLIFNQIPNKIEIGKLSVSGRNDFDANWEASENIDITEMDITSSAENNITLRAPIVRIAKEDSNKMDLTNDHNHIVIYADKLYIGEVDFGQHNTLTIHPYTTGQKVKVYIRQVKFSSNSQIIMDSGDYYIKDIDTHSSGENIVIMKASDENQKINLIVDPLKENHDFEIKSNVGINSKGVNRDFGNYNPANFRIFVNGDVEIKDGGSTINALIYDTGEVNLGTETYVRGAISSYKDITISNKDEFYWDDGINANCSDSSGGNETNNEQGMFDAWDTDHNITDRNITTKIVNKEFNLTIAALYSKDDNNGNNQEKSCKCGCGCKFRGSLRMGGHKFGINFNIGNGGSSSNQNSDIDIRYALFDNLSKINITTDEPFNISEQEKNVSFPAIPKAYKDVSVQFKVCADYDGNEYTLESYSECNSKCNDNKDIGKCIRTYYSTDNFAIRPDHFKVSVDDSKLYKADANISTISIEAVDSNDNDVNGYNESSSDLNLSAIDNKIENVPNMNYNFEFENGEAKIDYVKYPEVGRIKLKLSEKSGKEFAKVDEDDTPDNNRFIEYNISTPFNVGPDHFTIKDIKVNNGADNFTYISNDKDLNMSVELNATIVAENASNNPTKNYSGGLYEKDVTVKIPFTTDPENLNLNEILTKYGENKNSNDISNKEIKFTTSDGNFTNGEFNLSLKINFNRSVSSPTNAFKLILNDFNVTDEDSVKNSNDVSNDIKNKSQNIEFRYGKADPEDVSTYNSDEVNVPTHFYYYQDNDWVLNKDHNNKSQGDVNSTYPSSDKINVTSLNEDSISNGTQNIYVDINNIPSTPYKATLHLGIAPWLWYSKSGEKYKVPDENNQDCSTHPCANIIINKVPTSIGSENGWRGVSADSKNDVNKNTINIKRKDSEDSKIYHRINW